MATLAAQGLPEIVTSPDGRSQFLLFQGKRYGLTGEAFHDLIGGTRAEEFGSGRQVSEEEFNQYEKTPLSKMPSKEYLRKVALEGPQEPITPTDLGYKEKYPEYEGLPHDPDFGNPADPDLSNPAKRAAFNEFLANNPSTATASPASEGQTASPASEGQTASPASGPTEADDIIQESIDAVLEVVPEPPEPYEQVNPFFFDEALAREASIAEYSPYYEEMLSDYIADIERTKSRSQEDLEQTLDQLSAGKEYYLGRERKLLDKALRNTNEGWAGAGLFFSGAKERELRELKEEYGDITSEYLRKYRYNVSEAKETAERLGEDIATQRAKQERDISREKEYAVESGVLQRREEALEEYEAGRKKYYGAQYPGYLTDIL